MPETVVPVAPIFMQDAQVTLGADNDFAAAISSCTLTPSSSVVNWKGLKPGSSFSYTARATWTLDLNYAQDWETAAALSVYLHDHEGETVPFNVQPADGVEFDSFTGQVMLTPGPIGGAVDTVGESTVSLGVLGKPTRVPHA